jgi:hypothetical protein
VLALDPSETEQLTQHVEVERLSVGIDIKVNLESPEQNHRRGSQEREPHNFGGAAAACIPPRIDSRIDPSGHVEVGGGHTDMVT